MSDYYRDGATPDELEWGKTEDELYKECESSFHIGESVKEIECLECGGRHFNVGVGSYYTAIRCVNCEWEHAIHEG